MEFIANRFSEEFTLPFHNPVLSFTVILLIILLAPFLLRKIRIPGIIVLIFSGILIGPEGFNLIASDEAVNLFSTIGLLYIMFLAGLELDAREFARNRNKSILYGVLTCALPLLLGIPVFYYLLQYDLLTSILAASMLATHTLIAYPVVSRLNLSKNETVAITVGGTIITDTVVLIILALITGIHTNSEGWMMWIHPGISFLLFSLFMFGLLPWLARGILRRIANERYSHYIFVLATVFLSSFAAELAGLEPIIGAFLAGLVLNPLIPKTSPLMNKVEFVGNALFIPFFLISVGMIIDLQALLGGSKTWLIAMYLVLAGFLGKWLAAWITSRLLHYSSNHRNLIFGLSTARVAATLAVATVGYNLGLLDLALLNATIILILVSCVVSSMVTEQAARKLAIQQSTEMPVPYEQEHDRILVTLSNPETMKNLTDFALNISEPRKNEPVHVLSVVKDNQLARQKLFQARQKLEELIHHGADAEREIEIITTVDQNVVSGIRRVIKETAATDVVLGISPKSSFSNVLFGNLMQHLMNSTNQLLFFYSAGLPLYAHKQLQIICPPHSDKEYGFPNWLRKLGMLAGNLNIPGTFYSNRNTLEAIRQTLDQLKINGDFLFREANISEEIGQISKSFTPSDLILFIQPRRGSVSSFPSEFRNLTGIMDGEKSDCSYLIISPNHPDPVIE